MTKANAFSQQRRDIDTFTILGVPISVTSPKMTLELLVAWSKDRHGRYVCVRDVHGVMIAQTDDEFRKLHWEAALVTPDGAPLATIGRAIGRTVKRTTGPDLFLRAITHSETTGLRHFFYGGKPGVADELREAVGRIAPQAQIVGVSTPPFRPLNEEELDAVTSMIRRSSADVVWVGLSSPKQEFVMRDLARRTSATFIGIGAAFDFHAGRVRRAPVWMRRRGLEWLFRLLCEPRRLWWRYLVLAPKFVLLFTVEQLQLSLVRKNTTR